MERTLITSRSTKGSSEFSKRRWVEIEAYFNPGRLDRFELLVLKKSEVAGEHTIKVRYRANTANDLFALPKASAPMREVRDEVTRWARENGHG